ncbi:MAG: hypothetical protein J6K73_02855 [Clostridia bacterium]|nr:hypothetical protein [Clostridia bacterium]MBP3648702.1 hypothetical protein [Clostridia bacterium]
MSKQDERNRLPEGDDGHTIANMNVEGMPWYRPERPDLPPVTGNGSQDELTKKQVRMYTASALKAALLVASVMSLGLVAFVAFCVFVWFR